MQCQTWHVRVSLLNFMFHGVLPIKGRGGWEHKQLCYSFLSQPSLASSSLSHPQKDSWGGERRMTRMCDTKSWDLKRDNPASVNAEVSERQSSQRTSQKKHLLKSPPTQFQKEEGRRQLSHSICSSFQMLISVVFDDAYPTTYIWYNLYIRGILYIPLYVYFIWFGFSEV